MSYRILILLVLVTICAGCATQRQFTGNKKDGGIPMQGYEYRWTKIGEPISAANPVLMLKVEHRAVKRIVQKEYQVSRSLNLSQWLMIAGATGALGVAGGYEMQKGYVVLGRDLLGAGAAVPLSAYLYSRTGKLTVWKADTVKIDSPVWEPARDISIIAEIKKRGLRQDLRTDGDGKIRVDLKQFACAAPRDDDNLWIRLADLSTLGASFLFTEKLKDKICPDLCKITLISPKQDTIVYAQSLVIHGQVTSERGSCKLRVSVNGKDISSNQRGIEVIPNSKWLFSVTVPLDPRAENMITITAIDTKGNLSPPVQVKVTNVSNPKFWTVVIGISDYKDMRIPSLRYAHRDAQSFYDHVTKLREEGGLGILKSQARLLVNEQATTTNIREALLDFPKSAIEDDIVLIYFAGHGAPDPDRPKVLYLLTHDSELNRLGATAIKMKEIQDALRDNIKAKSVLVFIDACHSRGVSSTVTTRGLAPTDSVNRIIIGELVKSRSGALLFSASDIDQLSQEGEKWGGGHGVFTYYLLEGLMGKADVDNDKIVRLAELILYVTDNVRRDTKAQQTPIPISSEGFDAGMPLTRVVP